jgi:coenzyme F420-reducing hydrogenase gamma subunit
VTTAHRRPVPLGGMGPVAHDGRRMPSGLNPRMHDALTDLHTYVLALDAERQRLGDRVTELAKLVSQEGAVLDHRRTEIAEELDALRETLVALRACADPAGDRL